jgi:hypothetical protein
MEVLRGEIMKKITVICNQCGYEEKVDYYTREEAEREKIRIAPPRCSKCGSPNVKIRD